MKAIKEYVAIAVVLRVRRSGSRLEDKVAAHSQFCSKRSGLAGVIRLDCTMGNDRVRTLGLRLSKEKLQFSSLVSTGGKARAVVSLYPDFRSAKMI